MREARISILVMLLNPVENPHVLHRPGGPADFTTVPILGIDASVDKVQRYLCNANAADAEDA